MTQTIEQLTARVRELEEENARLKSLATTKGAMGLLADQLKQLAASQAYAEQLREAIKQYLAENDPSEFGCACDPLVGYLCGPCFAYKQQAVLRQALAQPSDTSALDSFVAEKVKEAGKFDMWKTNPYTKVLETSIEQLTKQRDLAVEALESCVRDDDGCIASAIRTIDTIKES